MAEKPSVARDIAKVLNITAKKKGYIEGRGCAVTWAFGHLVTLQESGEYDPALKRWSLNTLPFAGRERELIFRYILALCYCEDKPIRRLWLNSLTPEVIQAAFKDLKDGHDYDALYAAARCRSESDWIVGLNTTRYYTVRHGQIGGNNRVL